MQVRTKAVGWGGRPREFDEAEALRSIQRQLWTTGLSGASLNGIARSAGLNRPSLAAAFGDKDAIYAQAAAQFAAMMDARISVAIGTADLGTALKAAFDAAIDIYTTEGPDGCFVLCTAPAEATDQPGLTEHPLSIVGGDRRLFLKASEARTGADEDKPG